MSLKTWIVNLLLFIQALQLVVVGAANEGLDPRKSQPCSLRDPSMDPTSEKRYGVDVVWQIPPEPKGVLFLGHGGGLDAFGYFDPGPKCEQCYGLPESRRITLEALRRGYAVIVVKSILGGYDVMHAPLKHSKDLVIETNVLKEWTREHSLDRLPLAALGHSSGTFISSALTTTLPMKAIVLMCGEGVHEVEEAATSINHPPTFFAYMPRNKYVPNNENVTVRQEKAMELLEERGVSVTGAPCWPKPLSPLFFMERIMCMSEAMSQGIFAAFEAAGWIDSQGYVTMNPALEDWKSVLLNANALPFCEATGDLCLVKHVQEELTMAFAVHSVTSDVNDVVFPWLDATISSSSLAGAVLPLKRMAATN